MARPRATTHITNTLRCITLHIQHCSPCDVPSNEHEASASNGLSNEHAPGNYIQDQPTNTKQAQAPAGEESRANIVRKSREQEASTDSSARAPLAAWTAGLDLPGPHTKKKADRTSKGQSASFFGQVGMAAASSETSPHISTSTRRLLPSPGTALPPFCREPRRFLQRGTSLHIAIANQPRDLSYHSIDLDISSLRG